jgi:Mn-dependent DtxR family transcriptional regulator
LHVHFAGLGLHANRWIRIACKELRRGNGLALKETGASICLVLWNHWRSDPADFVLNAQIAREVGAEFQTVADQLVMLQRSGWVECQGGFRLTTAGVLVAQKVDHAIGELETLVLRIMTRKEREALTKFLNAFWSAQEQGLLEEPASFELASQCGGPIKVRRRRI